MEFSITPVENHRERENGVLVYPVYSRRSCGLSIGINLFPDKKYCTFNCPYCEVFPFTANAVFSMPKMEEELNAAIAGAIKQNIPIKDICFSGNGESTLSPDFPEALKLAAKIRCEKAPSARLVLITNGTGLLQPEIFSLLNNAAKDATALDIWLKLDAGTSKWYNKINRCEIPFKEITQKKKEFAFCAPVTIQTMLCAIDNDEPPIEEIQAWEKLLLEMIDTGGASFTGVQKVQIYGKARPAPEDPKSSPLSVSYLEERAESLRNVLAARNFSVPVEVYP